MSTHVGPLYHWAPGRLREKILAEGLRVMADGVPFQHPVTGTQEVTRLPWLCLATTPSSAWGLLPEPDAESPEEREDGRGWDLWQVQLSEHDHLHIRGDFSPYIREVRIENSVPADRCWWVGSRLRWPHEGIG